MIKCPNCHHKERNGTLFCSECGAEIFNVIPDGVSEVVLEFIETGKKLRLKENREYTIGRMGKTQALIPDVDLSQYGAFQKGVSRLHAIIKTYPGKCMIIDLDSANGTKINGERIAAYVDTPLKNGDTINLGSFKILLHISDQHVTEKLCPV
ncbi:FHA domain-containing protein [Leptolinea tardivitalis]|uniref:FHA domain-containing protein n=1 Tax=Leptolinea tardivitalis TaxID=229920 RepID=UPI0007813DC2|nr:FHA domain-containing protein [Leptolinea tardivitalis]GAP20077.1 protein containing FOG: FHA domain [Leptolinea tardivitalis]